MNYLSLSWRQTNLRLILGVTLELRLTLTEHLQNVVMVEIDIFS